MNYLGFIRLLLIFLVLFLINLISFIILDQIKGINYWYVMIRKGMTVTYDDFINHISSKEYYDANHVIALLNDDEIDALIEQYSVEI